MASYSFPWLLRWDRAQANFRLFRQMFWSGLLVGGGTWMGMILWLIYVQVGADGQRYFWTWVASSLLSPVPILRSVRLPYEGGGYAASNSRLRLKACKMGVGSAGVLALC